MTEHKTLTEALCAFQAEAPTLSKDTVNPHFKSKFTSLDTIVETVQPLLAKHGLTWSAFPCFHPVDGSPAMRYELAHVSGDLKSEVMPLLLSKDDSQGLGSALTYARRYSISAVLNLVSEDDDDGNRASKPPAQRAANGNGGTPQATATTAQPSERPATAAQRGLIFARAGEKSMESSLLANVVLLATENPVREWESEEAAQAWLGRSLDRLPAKAVDLVLEGIAGES